MMEPQQFIQSPRPSLVTIPTVVSAIEHVLELCHQAQSERQDRTISHVIGELELLRNAVAHTWPLPTQIKRQIDIGPFAVRNIEDWNEDLAGVLMNLDYSLQHDGDSIERIVRPHTGDSMVDAMFA